MWVKIVKPDNPHHGKLGMLNREVYEDAVQYGYFPEVWFPPDTRERFRADEMEPVEREEAR